MLLLWQMRSDQLACVSPDHRTTSGLSFLKNRMIKWPHNIGNAASDNRFDNDGDLVDCDVTGTPKCAKPLVLLSQYFLRLGVRSPTVYPTCRISGFITTASVFLSRLQPLCCGGGSLSLVLRTFSRDLLKHMGNNRLARWCIRNNRVYGLQVRRKIPVWCCDACLTGLAGHQRSRASWSLFKHLSPTCENKNNCLLSFPVCFRRVRYSCDMYVHVHHCVCLADPVPGLCEPSPWWQH